MRQVTIFLLLVLSCLTVRAQEETPYPCLPEPRLIVGEWGRVTPGDSNNLRAEPSTNASRIGEIPGDAPFFVMEGPTCVDGYSWWRVDYNGLAGWTVEGTAETYWLDPLSYSCQTHLFLNQPAITYDYAETALYDTPDGNIIGYIPPKTQFDVSGEFRCTSAGTWVTASYKGLTGWYADLQFGVAAYDSDAATSDPAPNPISAVLDGALRLQSPITPSLTLSPTAINASNISTISQVDTLGEGFYQSIAWSADGSQLWLNSTVHQYIYDMDNLQSAPQILNTIPSVSFSRNGRYRLETVDSHEAFIYDTQTDAEVLHIVTEERFKVYFAYDGNFFAVHYFEEQSGYVEVYEESTRLYRLDEMAQESMWVAWPKGHILIRRDIQTVALDESTGEPVGQITIPRVEHVNISPDGLTVAMLVTDCGGDTAQACWVSVIVWNMSNLEMEWRTVDRPEGSFTTQEVSHTLMQFDSNSGLAVVVVDHKLNWIGNPGRYYLDGELGEQVSGVSAIAFSPDHQILAIGGEQGEIRLVDMSSVFSGGPRMMTYLYGLTGSVRAIEFSPEGSRVAALGEDSTIILWDTASGQRLHTYTLMPATWPMPSSSTPRLRAYGNDRYAYVEATETGAILARLDSHATRVGQVSLSPDERLVLVSDYGVRDYIPPSLKLFDLVTGDLLLQLFEEDGMSLWSEGTAYSQDGRWIVIASRFRLLAIDLQAAGIAYDVSFDSGAPFPKVAIDPGNSLLVFGDGYGILTFYDLESGQVLATRETGGAITNLAFSSNGQTLYSDHDNGLVYIWEIRP